VGGQAVIEGVLMRSPRALAIAVRRPDGKIVVKDDDWHSISEKIRLFKLPFLRGAVMLFETLANGYQALSFSAAQQTIEPEKGTKVENSSVAEKVKPEDEKGELVGWALAGTMAFAFAAGIGLFVMLPHLLTAYVNPMLGISADVRSSSFHFVDGLIKMTIFVGYILLISRMPDIRRVFQYHGAEHKSIHVFEHAEPLDVEHTQKWPRLHPRCGTTFLLFVILVSIVVFTAIFPLMPELAGMPKLVRNLVFVAIKIPLMLPVAGISYEIIRIAGRFAEKPVWRQLYQPMMLMQRLTTNEPDAPQVEVALAALKAALAREEALAGGPVTADKVIL
jgi:uncharacterized protein YqhQ